jgi:hypothetical protein
MKKSYEFSHCWVHVDTDNSWTSTNFKDGTSVPATPNSDDQYKYWANYCGYADLSQMSREHEIAHTYISEKIGRKYSQTLWDVAHGVPTSADQIKEHQKEEGLVLAFQRFLNKNIIREELIPYRNLLKEWREEFLDNYRI